MGNTNFHHISKAFCVFNQASLPYKSPLPNYCQLNAVCPHQFAHYCWVPFPWSLLPIPVLAASLDFSPAEQAGGRICCWSMAWDFSQPPPCHGAVGPWGYCPEDEGEVAGTRNIYQIVTNFRFVFGLPYRSKSGWKNWEAWGVLASDCSFLSPV